MNAYLLNSLADVRIISEIWKVDYNTDRSHKSLCYLSPITYVEQNYKRLVADQVLYPQTEIGYNSKNENTGFSG